MKNMIYLGFLLAVILGCQSPDPSRVKKVAIQETQFRVPAEVGTTEDFASQSLDKCKYTNGYFYIDDYSNSFCVRHYRSADRRNHDVILNLNFTTGPGQGESRRLQTCTTLSSDNGEQSYLCEIGKRYFYLAYYQRSFQKDNRIWLEEIPQKQLTKRLSLNQEDFRANLKKIHGRFELNSNSFQRNKEFLDLIK